MNAKYEQRVANRLDAALSKLDHVGSVRYINCPEPQPEPEAEPEPEPEPYLRYINCSFPSVAADAPRMKLLEYSSLESSR
jgi:hypothetical protein